MALNIRGNQVMQAYWLLRNLYIAHRAQSTTHIHSCRQISAVLLCIPQTVSKVYMFATGFNERGNPPLKVYDGVVLIQMFP
ncbi:hypothetical protein ADP73_16605 [Serratia plymuthica]|nr:hypothetical protein ADP73_16605 [Serratia plymuthica]